MQENIAGNSLERPNIESGAGGERVLFLSAGVRTLPLTSRVAPGRLSDMAPDRGVAQSLLPEKWDVSSPARRGAACDPAGLGDRLQVRRLAVLSERLVGVYSGAAPAWRGAGKWRPGPSWRSANCRLELQPDCMIRSGLAPRDI